MSHHVCISLQLSWNTTVDDGTPCSQSTKSAAVTHSGPRYYRTHNYSQPLNLLCRQLDWRPLTGLLYSGIILHSEGAEMKMVWGPPVAPSQVQGNVLKLEDESSLG